MHSLVHTNIPQHAGREGDMQIGQWTLDTEESHLYYLYTGSDTRNNIDTIQGSSLWSFAKEMRTTSDNFMRW